jgi:hypothetical protein
MTIGTDIRQYVRGTGLWTLIAAARQTKAGTKSSGTLAEIAQYHGSGVSPRGEARISDEVWTDLEMDALFGAIDRCGCGLGQQVLYDILRRPVANPDSIPHAIENLDRNIRVLAANANARRMISAAVKPIGGGYAYELHRLITDELPAPPRWRLIFPVLSLIALAAIISMPFAPLQALLVLMAAVAANVSAQVFYRPRFMHIIGAISVMPHLLRAATGLAHALPDEFREVRDGLARCRAAFRTTRWLAFHLRRENSANDVIGAVAAYANLLFLADINAFVSSINELRRNRAELQYIIEQVGQIDALVAICEYRESLPHWCTPNLEPGADAVHATGIYHPLVPSPIPNDLGLGPDSVFVTGSNMGGKTTYLRAAGACAVLAQTIATCPARSWRAPPLTVMSLIDRSDTLTEGQSYFAVEARRIQEMIVTSATSRTYLYLIDEPFRGTNTVERLSAARAVLDALNDAGQLCIVASHDVDLKDLLKGHWSFFQFSDVVDGTGMRYNYRMMPGTATAGNALRLLRQMGYPEDIMAASAETFAELSK